MVAKRTPRKAPQDRKPRARKKPEPIKLLDIACGTNKADGATGIDLAGDADIVWDLFEYPWPIPDASVLEARCSHFVEHIPHHRPGWDRDGWWLFWDEVARILVTDGTVEVWHPYSRSDRAFWDPTHERFVSDQTWYYLDKGWREAQGLGHYPVGCDFEVVVIDGIGVPDEIMGRNLDYQTFARAHYFNVIADLHVTLRKR